MPAPIVPFLPSNFPSEIQSELNRRKTNRSFNFIGNDRANWDKDSGDWNTYKGPMTSWIRVCSNGKGHPLVKKERFILHSGKGFYQTYGFQPPVNTNGSSIQVIGYTPDIVSEKHVIENSLRNPSGADKNFPIHVGTPEVSRIEVVVQKELYRRATLEWVCFSWKQLEYMTPYFLVPGISIMIEWGWNHFNPISLVDLSDRIKMKELFRNAYPLYTDNILKSKGNYDVIYGIVTNFNWTIEGNKIICTTEITSKDRLYAGIVKDNGIMVKGSDSNEPRGIFKSLKDFFDKDENVINLKKIVSTPGLDDLVSIIKTNTNQNGIWSDIFRPLLNDGNDFVKTINRSHIFGIFSGRPKELYDRLGEPKEKDFDKNVLDNDTKKLWINMGLIVDILNHFSTLDSGETEPMFQVDILNTVIGGHPNLISCDPRVLIPNYNAPKFHYGFNGQSDVGGFASNEYTNQYVKPIRFNGEKDARPADFVLAKSLRQFFKKEGCYRNDLDKPINLLRYENVLPKKSPIFSYSFPSEQEVKLPDSPTGLKGGFVEKDVSGMLSNIYVSYEAFKKIIISNEDNAFSYPEIYKKLLQLLMDATDGFWDLSLIEAEGLMTIVDKRYQPSKRNQTSDKVYTFEYYDSDSLIKTLKFRPALTDAQATRAIYGETNNKDSKYSYIDKNDLLDYKFKDAIILTNRREGDPQNDLNKMHTSRQQINDLLSKVQKINQNNDDSLQMTISKGKDLGGKKEYIKLVLPIPQLLRILLDDKDVKTNSRYCAVQPGITLELTLLGIGGIRTFQYFLVKNLPEPYSEKNVIYRVTDVHHTLESGNWETVIRAGILPLNDYIKLKLYGPNDDGSWP